jgi:CheY-like chemotaxis protein
MDMRMPVMDGYEATRRIKATTKGQATVIVALTASALEEDREIILSEGCDAYMRKPFREHELFETLHQHLGVRFLYQEEAAQEGTGEAPRIDNQAAMAHRVSKLPAVLIEDLRQATILGYQDEILNQISKIGELDARLAEEFVALAKNYEHDKLLALLEKSEEEE